jgi:hypothetical protein
MGKGLVCLTFRVALYLRVLSLILFRLGSRTGSLYVVCSSAQKEKPSLIDLFFRIALTSNFHFLRHRRKRSVANNEVRLEGYDYEFRLANHAAINATGNPTSTA